MSKTSSFELNKIPSILKEYGNPILTLAAFALALDQRETAVSGQHSLLVVFVCENSYTFSATLGQPVPLKLRDPSRIIFPEPRDFNMEDSGSPSLRFMDCTVVLTPSLPKLIVLTK
nr:hypothetical protein Iba_chr10bCG2080 [Ipomoea batatas]